MGRYTVRTVSKHTVHVQCGRANTMLCYAMQCNALHLIAAALFETGGSVLASRRSTSVRPRDSGSQFAARTSRRRRSRSLGRTERERGVLRAHHYRDSLHWSCTRSTTLKGALLAQPRLDGRHQFPIECAAPKRASPFFHSKKGAPVPLS